MNFLAHLHIAEHCQSSLLGNLLGDFVKGNPNGKFPEPVVSGIKLHRFVDTLTDHHATLSDIKPLFTGHRRRFCAIALDMFWDHCLAKQWQDYHPDSLEHFCQNAEQKIKHEMGLLEPGAIPTRFITISEHMWQGRWLESYRDLNNIELALTRMSTRSIRMDPLKSCFPVLEHHYEVLMAVFRQLYPDVLTAAKRHVIC